MAITPCQARKYMGQAVSCRCHDGRVHNGIVRRVTQDGLWLEPMRGGAVSGTKNEQNFSHADKAGSADAQEVYWPLFFLPFLALAALSPFAYRPYGYGYGYGYGGYW